MAFGDFDYQELEDANYVLGPILFIAFVFFTSLFLMVTKIASGGYSFYFRIC